MTKAPASGRVLSNGDAALVKSMINRGDRQHDIAAYFAVNGGRIGEISKNRTFASVPAAAGPLPPAAPYLVLPASLRTVADSIINDLKAIGASKALIGKVGQIVLAMEASRQARQGK